jgi:hypothetical protein
LQPILYNSFIYIRRDIGKWRIPPSTRAGKLRARMLQAVLPLRLTSLSFLAGLTLQPYYDMTSGLPDSKTSTSKPSEPACTSASYLPSIQPTKAKRDKKKIAHKVAQVATNHVGINTDSTDAAESKDETSSSVRPKAQHGPTRTAAIPPDSNPKKDKSKGKSKKSKTDPKSSSKSNRPRLHPTQLTELATKIFNPALFPRQPPRTPPMYPPPGLCYSRLPPPCAEVDDGPTWRRRRWRVWDEVYTPLRRVVLNDHLRGMSVQRIARLG